MSKKLEKIKESLSFIKTSKAQSQGRKIEKWGTLNKLLRNWKNGNKSYNVIEAKGFKI